MSTNRLIVLAAGGTGGHVFPAGALARELSGRGYKLTLITDQRGGAYGGALGEIETHRVRAGGIAGKGPLAKVRSVVELGLGTYQARNLLKDTFGRSAFASCLPHRFSRTRFYASLLRSYVCV